MIVMCVCRSLMLIEKHVLRDVLGDGGWHSQGCVGFKRFRSPVTVRDTNVVLNYKPGEVCLYLCKCARTQIPCLAKCHD